MIPFFPLFAFFAGFTAKQILAKHKTPGILIAKRSTYAIVATAFHAVFANNRKQANAKTGSMVQVYILRHDTAPQDAVGTGKDKAICFTCPHRGFYDRKLKQWLGRSCYVNLGKGVSQVYKTLKANRYLDLTRESVTDIARFFAGLPVRFGAYGEPVLLGEKLVASIASVASKFTGYTHAWRDPKYTWAKRYFMASVETSKQRQEAKALGFRTFRGITHVSEIESGETLCPASKERLLTTCDACGICNGAGPDRSRYDVAIVVHGRDKRNALLTIERERIKDKILSL